jgi:hypothetical protein
MRIRTFRTIPLVVLILIAFSFTVWLLGKSALPKEKVVGNVAAICGLIVAVLYVRNSYVSTQEAEDKIKKAGLHDPEFRSEREIRTALREAAKVCWNAEEGDDAR